MTPTEQLREAVTQYLAEHPGAPFHEILTACERPEYLPEYGRYFTTVAAILRDLEQATV